MHPRLKTPFVRWTQEDSTRVLTRAAELMRENAKLSRFKALRRAQHELLPPEKHRTVTSNWCIPSGPFADLWAEIVEKINSPGDKDA